MTSLNQVVQAVSWFFALIEVIVGLYVLVLNAFHSSNRHLAGYLLIFAVNSYAVGAMAGAGTVAAAELPAILLAMTTPAIPIGLLIVSVNLLKPSWMASRKGLLWLPIYLLAASPVILTLSDVLLDTRWWYTGLDPASYNGGFAVLPAFTAGIVAPELRIIEIGLSSLAAVAFFLYVALLDQRSPPANRRLAWLLLAAEVIATIMLAVLANSIEPVITIFVTNTVFVLVYSYASFMQMISERRLQRGSLQLRMSALVLVVALPILMATVYFISSQARARLEIEAQNSLRLINDSVANGVSLWLEGSLRAMRNLAQQPDLVSMQPERQKPLLEALARSYPEMYLVSTTDLNGLNVARSDNAPLADFSDQAWFRQARRGESYAIRILAEPGTGRPAMVASLPIRDPQGDIIGVAMFASQLTAINDAVRINRFTSGQISYVVDIDDRVLAHPEAIYSAELRSLREYPPVRELRSGARGDLRFRDAEGINWRAYLQRLSNGWGVIVQQREADLLAPARRFEGLAAGLIALGAVLLFGMVFLTIRQSLRPVVALTETTAAITAGDLSRIAPVETEDELGFLARAFNSMTSQLRDLISGLEKRVAERTQQLERRAVQLTVAADVARQAAAIRDLDQLLDSAVRLISERFGFYHAGIFLVDDAGEFAVLQAASSDGGQRMLARKHQLKIGEVGIVGFVAARGEPRIALDVGADAVFFNNPDLPRTRSEMALPLMVRGEIIGALDVQSTQPSAFKTEDIEILQILADQIALAIDNTRLVSETGRALQELEIIYAERVQHDWQRYLQGKASLPERAAYQYQRSAGGAALPANDNPAPPSHTLSTGIFLRGQKIGSLVLRRDPRQPAWSEVEQRLIEEVSAQIAQAMENARLVEEIQQRAAAERLMGEIVSRTQKSLHLDAVLQTIVAEIGQALQPAAIQIRLADEAAGEKPNGNGGGAAAVRRNGSPPGVRRRGPQAEA